MALYDCDGVTIIISTEIFLFYLDIGSVSMPMNFSSNGTSSSCKSSVEGALMGSRPTGCVYHLLIKKKKGSSNRTSFAAYGATWLWGRVH